LIKAAANRGNIIKLQGFNLELQLTSRFQSNCKSFTAIEMPLFECTVVKLSDNL